MDPVLSLFHDDTANWFDQVIGTPTQAQREGWPAVAKGEHTLISAPTGTGKTLSAFLVYIDRLKRLARQGELGDELYLLYISPLKALGNDIRENLRRPLEGIVGPDITAAVRTGDTTPGERQRMIRKPPHILITTPESLFLLLTSKSGRNMLASVQAVIVDELHAMIGSKRGAHLMLSLSRLDALCRRNVQRVGLSATIEPLDVAAQYLGGGEVRVVAPPMEKRSDIQVNSPLEDMRLLPEGTIWPELARQVVNHCQGARTVIAFVEGRAQAEKLAYYVNQITSEGFARTHHGCVSKEQRLEAEQQLRSGELRLMCATSSMELGIDVGEVDLVLQIGYPRTISSTLQRLGRAGHNPGRVSVMHLFPRTAAESLYCGMTAKIALEGGIEQAHPPRQCFDVVSQHLVSMAACGEITVSDALAIINRAYNFRHVTIDDLRAILRMLSGDYEHELDRPARPRLLYDRIHDTITGDNYSRMLALSAGGTIPDRGWFAVRLSDGTKLGELDEEFVFEARVGGKFLLGAFAWKILEIRRDSVIVASSNTEGAQTPFWRGDQAGRGYQTGLAFGAIIRELMQAQRAGNMRPVLRSLRLDDAACDNTVRFIAGQVALTDVLPDDRTILVEHFADQAGENQMMVHSIFGRQVNAGLALLVQEALRRKTGLESGSFEDDDGFLIFPYNALSPLPEGLLYAVQPGSARAILEALLPATPVFNMAFRYNAGRALMMGVRRGQRLPLWVQRLRGAQVLDDAVGHKDHPLIVETRRECLEDYWDLPAIEEVLTGIHSGRIAVREVHLQSPSPMSLPLRRQVEAVMTYEYHPTPASAHQAVSEALEAVDMIAPDPEQLSRVQARSRQPQDIQQLHSLLMAEGDVVAGELDVPLQWFETLLRQKRALYIEPGLWICAEQEEQYQAALTDGERQACLRVVRRCLRYRGAQDGASLSARYFLPEEVCRGLLADLVASADAVADDGLYYHAQLYNRAQRETVFIRRKQVETLPPWGYAAYLSNRARLNAPAAEQLHSAVESLLEVPFAPEYWESILLPARVSGYQSAMLDDLLAQGEFFWQVLPGEKPLMAFYRYADIDWDADCLADGAALDDAESAVVKALKNRGALFAQGLSGVLPPEVSALDVLLSLAGKGLVRADSFIPARQWMKGSKGQSMSPRIRVRERVRASMAGRWELSRPLLARDMESRLERAFDRCGLLCRETSQGLAWNQALEVLRIWEYTGRVRRGYFVQGLSGAQFIRESDYRTVMPAMEQPMEETVWINAIDPLQPWGKSLAHMVEDPFTNVYSTLVALRAGQPVAVLERRGNVLRVFQIEHLTDALRTLARDFAQNRVYAGANRIRIKKYPKEATPALEAAGFSRQMLDFELWHKQF